MSIRLKRVYDEPAGDDGARVLIDRVWPRGIKKEDAALDSWMKEAAPSTQLRKWFNHDPSKWEEFRKRCFRELDDHPEEIGELKLKTRKGRLTLLYGSKEMRFNNAVALKEYLEKK